MKKAAFLISVAAAAACLVGGASAAVAPTTAQAVAAQSAVAKTPAANALSGGTLVGYVLGDEQHQLLMQRDASGTLMAYHRSHSSHHSHRSHSSHRSSAY